MKKNHAPSTPSNARNPDPFNEELVFKQDVAIDLAQALMRLGKNDFDGVKQNITLALFDLETWLRQRPEKNNK